MSRLLAKGVDIFRRISDYAAVAAACLMVLAMLSISMEITQRSLLNRTTPWLLEVNEYILLFMTLLASAWVLRKEGHVRVDFALTQLSPTRQEFINAVTSILGAAICLAIFWYSIQTAVNLFQLGYREWTMLSPPKWIILSVIPLGFLLLAIQFMVRSHRYLRSWRTNRGR